MLVVLGYAGQTESSRKHPVWWVQCGCGTCKLVIGTNLNSGAVISCGCENRRRTSDSNRKHGMSKSVEFKTWSGIKSRCVNPSDKAYRYYGGRGIKMCDRWANSFETFLSDMGCRPDVTHSIDRVDVNGNYEPGNCRWANRVTQARNTRCNRVILFNGMSKCCSEWEEALNLPRRRVSDRLQKGWTEYDALTTPVVTRIKPPSQTASTDQHA